MSGMRWTEEQLAEYNAKRGNCDRVKTDCGLNDPKAKLLEKSKPIIKQSRAGLNKTEQRFINERLNIWKHEGLIDVIGEHESITLRVANGLRLRPDFPTWKGDKLTFYEVKGAHIREDSIKSLKIAANKYPRCRFFIYQYVKGEWFSQEVLP